MKKKMGLILSFMGIIMSLTGCSTVTANISAPSMSAKQAEQILENAKTITVKQRVISFNRSYSILVRGEKVGTVQGKVVYLFGDTFKLKSPNGQVLLEEKEIPRFLRLTRAAVVENANQQVVGYYGETLGSKFLHLGSYIYFYNQEKQPIGVADENVFSWMSDYNFKNMQNQVLYQVHQNFSLWGNDYQITVEKRGSSINVENAILMTCVLDAIHSAQNKKNK